ncbi:MAG: response regulator [Nitrospiraceae bacterium]|nr:MAG: response regulator [Nitrospiraceae bacterium]
MESSILLVDDERSVVSSLKRALMDEPYNIFTANSGIEGLSILKDNRIKIVISDEKMPGMQGSEFLSAVKKLFPDTIRIILTGHASIQAAMNAVNNGEIYRFFAKPWNEIELKLAIRSAIEKYDLEDENKRLLKTVKRQACELQQLEKSYPGITSMEKDDEGNLVLPDISDSSGDMADIVSQIEIQLKAKGNFE